MNIDGEVFSDRVVEEVEEEIRLRRRNHELVTKNHEQADQIKKLAVMLNDKDARIIELETALAWEQREVARLNELAARSARLYTHVPMSSRKLQLTA